MKCQDVSLILDDGDVNVLNPAQRRRLRQHLASCPACWRDWYLQSTLASGAVPRQPPEFQKRVMAMVDAMEFAATGGMPRSQPVRRLSSTR